MKRRAVIENCVGETRAAVYEGRKLVELHLDRWSRSALPKIGEIWTGQVVAIDASIGGMFVKLGEGEDGLLSFKAQSDLPRLTEGQMIDVKIVREALGKKGPNLRYHGEARQAAVGPIERLSLKARLSQRFPEIEFEDAPVGVIDTACERQIALKGGGSITIDRTEALLAVDVDKGGAERVTDCALEAARTSMSQLRLRGLGGLVIIDFPNLRQPKQRSSVIKILETLAESDPANVRVAPFSRFGVVELTRGQDGPSLDAILNNRFGDATVETRALRALRRLEREAKASAGAKLELTLPHDEMSWLETCGFDWRAEMTERIGARFSVDIGDKTEVVVDR